ncbi:MAG: hypothetical protein KDA85_05710, partial [Planctomycetaceae bacterium]|nr:hypothetical protein [Planctomycetaceae bacterium]
EQPAQWEFPENGRITLLEAARQARPAAVSYNVALVRPSAQRILTSQFVNAFTHADSLELQPSDIVVVSAVSELQTPVPQNVGISTSAGPMCLTIFDGTTLTDIADELSARGFSLRLADAQILNPRQRGRRKQERTSSGSIIHGDVIVPAHTTTAVIPVSGIQPGMQTVNSQPHLTADTSSTTTPFHQTTFNQQMDNTDNWSTGQGGGALAIPATPTRALLPNAASEMAPVPPPAAIPDKLVSTTAAVETRAMELPAVESVIGDAPDEATGIWNFVFVAGMIIAGFLIIGGWLRAQHELPASAIVQTQGTSANTSYSALTNVSRPQKSSAGMENQDQPQTSPPALMAGMPSRVTDQQTAAKIVSSSSVEDRRDEIPSRPLDHSIIADARYETSLQHSVDLVGQNEWFSQSEWQQQPARRAVGGPARSTLIAEELVAAALSKSVVSEDEKSVYEETDLTSTRNRPHETVQSATDNPAENTTKNTVVETASVATSGDVVGSAEAEAITRRLEDLIRNRTTIQHGSAHLPQKMILFGRPSGPVKLRIDAAHRQIPAPHLNLAADRQNRPVAVKSAAVSDSSSAEAPQSPAGLDRALHFLHERNEE